MALDLLLAFSIQVSTQIGKLLELRSCILDENKISFIPPVLGTLPELKELLLDPTVVNVPAPIHAAGEKLVRQFLNATEMGFMTNILDCSGYRLTMLPGMEGAMTSLTELKLSNNLLKRLPDRIEHFENLKILWLDGNGLRAGPPQD